MPDGNPDLNKIIGHDFSVSAPTAVIDPPADDETIDPNAAPAAFRREIDLGDGGGKQVFEADTAEALIDKLTEAQTNATKKIREQNQLLKRPVRVQPDKKRTAPVKVEAKPLSTDDEFAIAQQFSSMPRKAFETLFTSVVGLPPSEFRSTYETVKAFELARDEEAAAMSFVQKHTDDYQPTQQNSAALFQFLEREGLATTENNLEYAFQSLSGTHDFAPTAVAQPTTPVVPAAAAPVRRASSSGLSARNSARQPEAAQIDESEVQEIMKLPHDERLARIVQKVGIRELY